MPQFGISWRISTVVTSDERNRTILKRILDDEWAIVCVIQKDIVGNWKYTSIELQRKNTARKFSISGNLIFFNRFNIIWSRTLSHVIKTKSTSIEIVSDLDVRFYLESSSIIGNVEISDIGENQSTSFANEESKERIQLKSLEKLSKDLERLLNPESSCFADFTLKCDGVSIPAHKYILSARSPVFASMFANSMRESLKNEVDITDMEVPVLRALLMYMYTGKTSDMNVASATDLLFAADKYQLQDLKEVCWYFLKDAVSVQNVWSILVMGDMHSEDLKSFAMDYICNNYKEFSVLEKTQEWIDLRRERADLAMELLESLVKYRDEKLKRIETEKKL